MDEVGWYINNANAVRGVGLKASNAWRLFDMHGNLREMCLDWYSSGEDYSATFGENYKWGDVVVSPVGASSGSKRVDRGTSYNLYSAGARSGARQSFDPAESSKPQWGFRVVCPANIVIAE